MTDFTLPQTIVISLIFAVAAVIHGAFGIGFPMLPTAVLSLVINMQDAVVLTLWPNLCINILVLFSGGPVGRIVVRYWLLAVSALAGSAVGAYLLFVVAQSTLQLLLAGAIFIYVYAGFRGYSIRVSPDNRGLAVAFGLVAGMVGGATNAMAPILLIYLFSVTQSKHELAQAANLCFLLGKIAQIIVIYAQPTANTPDVVLLFILLSVTLGALFVGIRIRHKIPGTLFRKLILILLLFLGIALFLRGISQG